MLTAVKNQIKVNFLAIKYNIMRQMINKTTFITNVLFMILNNASFIIQWVIIFSVKNGTSDITLKEVLLIWGVASSTFGISHLLFYKAFDLPEIIINGKLDTFLVQPKNVFLGAITSETSISALGDLIYGYICLAIYGITFRNFILFTIFAILGGITITAFASILGSLSFWIVQADMISQTMVSILLNTSTYPKTIFKQIIKILLYTIIPVGISTYIPAEIIIGFDLYKLGYMLIGMVIFVVLAFIIFYRGLKRYSSTNLMSC